MFHYKDINQFALLPLKDSLSPRRKRVSRLQTIYIWELAYLLSDLHGLDRLRQSVTSRFVEVFNVTYFIYPASQYWGSTTSFLISLIRSYPFLRSRWGVFRNFNYKLSFFLPLPLIALVRCLGVYLSLAWVCHSVFLYLINDNFNVK